MSRVVRALVLLSLPACISGCQPQVGVTDPLAWTVGSWHGVRRSADDGLEAPMTVRVEALADGVGQVECLRVERSTEPYVGFAVRRRDAAGDWGMVYANGTQRAFARLGGQGTGARTTWIAVTEGRTRESRLASERLDINSWRKTQEISEDGGATWRVLFVDELKRDVVE